MPAYVHSASTWTAPCRSSMRRLCRPMCHAQDGNPSMAQKDWRVFMGAPSMCMGQSVCSDRLQPMPSMSASSRLWLLFITSCTSALGSMSMHEEGLLWQLTESCHQREKVLKDARAQHKQLNAHQGIAPIRCCPSTQNSSYEIGAQCRRHAVVPQHTLPSPGGVIYCVVHNIVVPLSTLLLSSWPLL